MKFVIWYIKHYFGTSKNRFKDIGYVKKIILGYGISRHPPPCTLDTILFFLGIYNSKNTGYLENVG